MMAEQWFTMLRRSFDPREWFSREAPQWYFVQEDNGKFAVGRYIDGRWIPSGEEYKTKQEAIERIQFLNGGAMGELSMA